MARRGRMRRVAKWAGLSACVLIVCAGGASMRWRLGLSWNASGDIAIDSGAVHVLAYDRVGAGPRRIMTERARGPMRWWLRAHRYTLSGYTSDWYIVVPLWMPLTALALPTAWAWHRDRRAPRPGRCPCGYDLAGLAPGAACPECGCATGAPS